MKSYEPDSRVDRLAKRRQIAKKERLCSICPPHGGENAGRKHTGRHGKTKPKYKDKRK